ncbi:MAG: VWA domain-containing protein [Candidatus Eremiobacteraeota bacterium]|nr:VWA domain-containing protein [Candidatus Eremiobacteraeota bacterium]
MRARAAAVAALFLALAACGGSSGGGGSSAPAMTLDVVAGSELKDMEPILADAQRATGVAVQLSYVGTIAGIDRLSGGEKHDAAWFAQDKYLALSSAGKSVRARTRIMLSPVILGVKHSVAQRLGWDGGKRVTWRQIENAVSAGNFRYAMTNPSTSNSGFSAVLSVATALAGTGDALRPSDVNRQAIASFYKGQHLVSGSSGWLSDAYLDSQDTVDGIITYEASIAALDNDSRLKEKLDRVYPADGVMTADYPIDLLDESKQPAYDKLVAYLKSPDVQKRIADTTYRRPTDTSVATHYPAIIAETPFPASAGAVQQLLLRFLNQDRVPAHSFYVLDKTGSMDNDDGTGKTRIQRVQDALAVLTGSDDSLTGQFARFADRERVTIITFSVHPEIDQTFTMAKPNDPAVFGAVKNLAAGLQAGGNTAIYDALEAALNEAVRDRSADAGRYDSIVLMTDGENNRGDDYDAFRRKRAAMPAFAQRIRIFPIFIGEASPAELERIASLTGGRAFDARKESLAGIFKEIRGYQ